MPENPTPEFANEDNALIWGELVHIRKALDKLNGAVIDNTDHRITCRERWRAHEKDHDNVKRDNVIGSSLAGAFAFIAAIARDHLV
jgi:hypothetical protein